MPILLCDYYTIFSVVYIQNVTTTLKSVFSEKLLSTKSGSSCSWLLSKNSGFVFDMVGVFEQKSKYKISVQN